MNDDLTSNAKILFIEDDDLLVNAYKIKLLNEGFEPIIAKDGEEALKKLQTEKYDLILLDLLLPKIDGFTVLEKLRGSTWPNNSRPVIILSNLGQESDLKKAKELGADDYMIKANFSPNQIMQKIKQYL